MAKHSDNARARLLDMMLEIVCEQGAAHLTYDNLVAKSGLTRGGILYHFPSKQSMLEGLVNHYIARELSQVNELWDSYGKTPDALLRAEIECAKKKNATEQNLAAALLPVIAQNPNLLDGIRTHIRERYDLLDKTTLGFERGAFILMALDCFEMSKAFGIEIMSIEKRKQLLDFLMDLVEKKESL